jgi:hypothetical protein
VFRVSLEVEESRVTRVSLDLLDIKDQLETQVPLERVLQAILDGRVLQDSQVRRVFQDHLQQSVTKVSRATKDQVEFRELSVQQVREERMVYLVQTAALQVTRDPEELRAGKGSLV